jgi:uroporphyrin-III C-methyltransferase
MTVSIVGVGPGDAELMTLKAARLLREANAVVYDRLIGNDVLDYVSPLAERYGVGKTPGRPSPQQSEINDLLIGLGRRFDNVVRVKGGDPFVFGRGIEEVRACEMAGVAVSVVPGITSALAGPLMAGISVTERGVSSGFCVVTAHQDQGSDPLDWLAIVRTGLTIVVMMGARRAAHIRDRLLNAGLPPTTPTAIATNVTCPNEHSWHGSLNQLGTRPVRAPAVLVIGEAAGRSYKVSHPSNRPQSTLRITERR